MSENPSAAQAAPTPVETVIIGAGPVGLFQIFELGLLGIRTHIIDSLPQAGGQCTELYPDKPIYDIPALPICGAQELIDRLLEQAKPFHATFHLGRGSDRIAGSGRRQVPRRHLRRHPSHCRCGGDRGGRRLVPAAAFGAARRRGIRGQKRSLSHQIGRRFSRTRPGDMRRRRFGPGLDGGAVRQGALPDAAAPSRGISRRSRHRCADARIGRRGQDAGIGGQCRGLAHGQRQAGGTRRAVRADGRDVAAVRRARARLLRTASEAGTHRRMGHAARKARTQGRHREISDQHPGDLRHRRHQHLSGQEEAHPERFSRSRARRIRHPASLVPREAAIPAVHHHESHHAEAAGRRRSGFGHASGGI